MKKLIVATKNKGKLHEISEILTDFPYDVVSMEDVGINNDIEETGKTFEENALIKALEINKLTGEIVIADDSEKVVIPISHVRDLISALREIAEWEEQSYGTTSSEDQS